MEEGKKALSLLLELQTLLPGTFPQVIKEFRDIFKKLDKEGNLGTTENIFGERRPVLLSEVHENVKMASIDTTVTAKEQYDFRKEMEALNKLKISRSSLLHVIEKKRSLGENAQVFQTSLGNVEKKISLRQAQAAKQLNKCYSLPLRKEGTFRRKLICQQYSNKVRCKDIQEKILVERISKTEVVKKITAHTSSVYCVRFSPNGKTMVTGSDDYLLKSFDVVNFSLLKTFRGHKNCLVDIAIYESPGTNKEVVISSSIDTFIRLWDLRTAACIMVLTWHKRSPGPMVVSNNGTLVTVADDGCACVWNTEAMLVAQSTSETWDETVNTPADAILLDNRSKGAKIPIVLPHAVDKQSFNVNCVSLHPNNEFIVTGSDDGIGRIWSIADVPHRRCRQTADAELFSGLNTDHPYIYGNDRLCCSVKAHNAPITEVHWSNLGDRILSSSVKDSTAKIWKWNVHETIFMTKILVVPNFFAQPVLTTLHTLSTTKEPFDTAENQYISNITSSNWISERNMLYILKKLLKSIETSQEQNFDINNFMKALPVQERNIILKLVRDKSIRKDDLPTMDVASWTCDDSRIITMQSRPTKPTTQNENNILHELDTSAFSDQILKVWDARTGNLLFQKRKHRRPCYSMLPHPTFANVVVTLGHDSQIIFWDIKTETVIKALMVPTMHYPAALLDGAWLSEASMVSRTKTLNDINLVVTDRFGRIIVLSPFFTRQSTGESDISSLDKVKFVKDELKSTYSEQFFANDYRRLDYDSEGKAIDSLLNLEPHLCPQEKLCERNMEPYSIQPLKRLDATSQQIHSNLLRRQQLISFLDLSIQKREENTMVELKDKLELMDSVVSLAETRDNASEFNISVFLQNCLNNNLGINHSAVAASPEQPVANINRATRERLSSVGSTSQAANNAMIRRSERQRERTRQGLQTSYQLLSTGARPRADNQQTPEPVITNRGGPRRRAARRAGQRIRFYRDVSLRIGANTNIISPLPMPVENNDSESSDGGSSVRTLDDPEEIIRRNRLRKRAQRQRQNGETGIRRSSRLGSNQRQRRRHSLESEHSSSESEDSENFPLETSETGSSPQISQGQKEANRDWLRVSRIDHIFGNYLPQMGDEVVFCVQGFEEYSKLWTGQPLPDMPELRDFPYVLCKVGAIEYNFPQQHYVLVNATVTLKVLASPRKDHSSSRFWNYKEGRSAFNIVYVSHDLPEFLILKPTFEQGMRHQWKKGEKVITYYQNVKDQPETLQPSEATVVGIQPKDLERFPDSVWQQIQVKWVDGLESGLDDVSPWEVDKVNQPPLLKDFVNSEVALADGIKATILSEIQELKQKEYVKEFIHRVDTLEVPDYERFVEVPMELDLIEARLENSYYRSLESLKFDVELIYSNCLKFNLAESLISQEACLFHAAFKKSIDKIQRGNSLKPRIRSRKQASMERKTSTSQSNATSRTSTPIGEMIESPSIEAGQRTLRRRKQVSYEPIDSDEDLPTSRKRRKRTASSKSTSRKVKKTLTLEHPIRRSTRNRGAAIKYDLED